MTDHTSLDKLREEDYTLSSVDLPTPAMYKAADGIDRPCVGKYWLDICSFTHLVTLPKLYLEN